jgi:predicted PurR-regulated permease PerM
MVGPKQLSFFPSLIQQQQPASQPKKNKNNIQRTTTTTDKINRERLAMRIPSNREQIVMSLLSTSIHLLSPAAALFFSPSLFFFFARLK